MIHDQQVLTASALLRKSNPSPLLSNVHRRVGLQRLQRAFQEPRPLTILTGSSTADTSGLISSFLDGVQSDVTVVRIDSTCSDALAGMRAVIRTTGFEPQKMSLIELEIVFVKFLSLQRFHGRRTIMLIEESQDNECWVPDKVRDLVKLEAAGKFGLMVILARQAGSLDQTDVLELDVDTSPATINPTKKAHDLFPISPGVPPPAAEPDAGLAEWTLSMDSDATIPLKKTLQNRCENLHDLTLEQPRLMIGRAEDNDLCIKKRNVSRHHAILVRHGAAAVVMDLNSTNGTYVNSRQIKDQVVVHHDIIAIGDHRIRFIASNTG